MEQAIEPWQSSWQDNPAYADLFYRRAIGDLPEMESSKAAASFVASEVRDGDSILDVGCGGGHYLRSLKRVIPTAFSYTGVDATEEFLAAARRAWEGQANVSFVKGDVFGLQFDENTYDVVMCNNVLYHLPSVAKPLAELIRVARRTVIVHMLVGERSYRVQEVFSKAWKPESAIEAGDEFDEAGEPRSFAYLNIYGKPYLDALFSRIAPGCGVEFIEDTFFEPKAIEWSAGGEWGNPNPTRMLAGKQLMGPVISPQHFVLIHKPQ